MRKVASSRYHADEQVLQHLLVGAGLLQQRGAQRRDRVRGVVERVAKQEPEVQPSQTLVLLDEPAVSSR
jgi:hypothetical protein